MAFSINGLQNKWCWADALLTNLTAFMTTYRVESASLDDHDYAHFIVHAPVELQNFVSYYSINVNYQI